MPILCCSPELRLTSLGKEIEERTIYIPFKKGAVAHISRIDRGQFRLEFQHYVPNVFLYYDMGAGRRHDRLADDPPADQMDFNHLYYNNSGA